MSFEWDENKRQTNIAKHGIDFVDVLDLFDAGNTVTFEDNREDYGEQRFVLLGFFGEKLFHIVFTIRGDVTRIISARRATRLERKLYDRFKNY